MKMVESLLLSLGVNHLKAIPLFSHSQSALHIANHVVFHERTKHIEVECHFVRWCYHKWPYCTFLCLHQGTTCRHLHEDTWQGTIWVYSVQVWHYWSFPCSNLMEVLENIMVLRSFLILGVLVLDKYLVYHMKIRKGSLWDRILVTIYRFIPL